MELVGWVGSELANEGVNGIGGAGVVLRAADVAERMAVFVVDEMDIVGSESNILADRVVAAEGVKLTGGGVE